MPYFPVPEDNTFVHKHGAHIHSNLPCTLPSNSQIGALLGDCLTSIHKYRVVFQTGLKMSLEFRADLLMGILLSCLPMLTLLFVFTYLYTQHSAIGQYSFTGFVQFAFLTMFIRNLTTTFFEEIRTEQIKNGAIDHALTHPFSFFSHILVMDIARVCFKSLFSVPVLLLTYLGFTFFYHVHLQVLSLEQTLSLCVLFLFAYIVESQLSLLITALAFWVDNAVSLQHFKWFAIAIFGGAWLPKSFLPAWWQQVMSALPFQYLYAVPVEVVLGRYTLGSYDYTWMAVASVFLVSVSLWFWRASVKKYVSAGG